MADDPTTTPAADDETTCAEAERMCVQGLAYLIDLGFDGVTLSLLAAYLEGCAEAASDGADMGGAKGALGHELDRLRPLMRARGYGKQLAHGANANGPKVGAA